MKLKVDHEIAMITTEYNANQSWNIAIFGHENYFSGSNQPKQLGYSVRCVMNN